jgi:hypothetical protein
MDNKSVFTFGLPESHPAKISGSDSPVDSPGELSSLTPQYSAASSRISSRKLQEVLERPSNKLIACIKVCLDDFSKTSWWGGRILVGPETRLWCIVLRTLEPRLSGHFYSPNSLNVRVALRHSGKCTKSVFVNQAYVPVHPSTLCHQRTGLLINKTVLFNEVSALVNVNISKCQHW